MASGGWGLGGRPGEAGLSSRHGRDLSKWASLDEVQGQIFVPVQPWSQLTHFLIVSAVLFFASAHRRMTNRVHLFGQLRESGDDFN